MAKTTKIMDINMMNGSGKFICIYDSAAKFNPFKLYLKWYSPGTGWHRKKLADYADTQSVLCHIATYR